LLSELDSLVDPETRGDPMCPLRWTTKSTDHPARALQAMGHTVSPDTVGRLLKEMGYSLQAPAKENEGVQSPDRDAQFRYLNGQVEAQGPGAAAEGSANPGGRTQPWARRSPTGSSTWQLTPGS
jgi:hypothetical protein